MAGDPQHDYQVRRSNDAWPIHKIRTLVTGGMIAWLRPGTVCDPACGDASLLQTAHLLHPIQLGYLGDISHPSMENLDITFPNRRYVQDAAKTLEGAPPVDLVVLTEFLEHVQDPDSILRLARQKGTMLVASSPLNENESNPEHFWAWDGEGYQEMLKETGWNIDSVIMLQVGAFTQQIYSAR